MKYESLKYNDEILPIILKKDVLTPFTHMSIHWHNATEILLVTKGKLRVLNDEQTQLIDPGTIVCVHSGRLHCYTPVEKNAEYYYMILPSELFDDEELFRSPLPFSDCDADNIETYKTIVTLMEQKPKFYKQLTKSYIIQLYAHLASKHQNMQADKERRVITLVKETVEYINKNYEKFLSVEQIAEIMGVSAPHLCRVFKSVTGNTLAQYWQHIRCNAARRKLRKGYSVTQAADLCGFSSPSYFTKVYYRYFGCLPKADRK